MAETKIPQGVLRPVQVQLGLNRHEDPLLSVRTEHASERVSSTGSAIFLALPMRRNRKCWIISQPRKPETDQRAQLVHALALLVRRQASRKRNPQNTVGRMTHIKLTDRQIFDTLYCPATVSDGQESTSATIRCDDGSDDSLISPILAERAVLQGIGKRTFIEPVRLNIALNSGDYSLSLSQEHGLFRERFFIYPPDNSLWPTLGSSLPMKTSLVTS